MGSTLASSAEMLLPGMQCPCPLGQAKQSPSTLQVWKREDLTMRHDQSVSSRHIKQQGINLHSIGPVFGALTCSQVCGASFYKLEQGAMI